MHGTWDQLGNGTMSAVSITEKRGVADPIIPADTRPGLFLLCGARTVDAALVAQKREANDLLSWGAESLHMSRSQLFKLRCGLGLVRAYLPVGLALNAGRTRIRAHVLL